MADMNITPDLVQKHIYFSCTDHMHIKVLCNFGWCGTVFYDGTDHGAPDSAEHWLQNAIVHLFEKHAKELRL